ncbi:chromate transporter [Olivibacter sp. LS-1]|nr:chromate transporter [Olivibacter sp. LS-1]
MIFFRLFWVFTKIGVFGFGGGYAMLSLIQDEVVEKNNWMTKQQFTDLIAVSQMTPGPIGINTATYAGYTALENSGSSPFVSILGSVVATFSLCLPSFILIILISYFFSRFRSNKYFAWAMTGVRLLSVALIGLAAVSLMNHENFIDYFSPLLFLGALFLSVRYKLHPVFVIAVAAVIGIFIY